MRGLRKLKEIKTICLEGSLIQEKSNLKAGATDIDLIIITEELSFNNELEFMNSYIKKFINLKKIFPFLKDYSALNESSARIHSYAKILGPYHFKKYDRLYKVIYGSADYNHSPNKLNFSLESYTAADFFILFRTALRSINEDIYNASVRNMAYVRNSITSAVRIIDYIDINISGFKCELAKTELRKKIKIISEKNFFIYANDYQLFISAINDLYKLSEECLNRLLLEQRRVIPADNNIRMTRNNFPNETLEYAAKEIREKISCSGVNTRNLFHNISIVPDYNCNYNYIIYIIVKDCLNPQAIKCIYGILEKIYTLKAHSFVYYSKPVILTKNMFKINKKLIESYCGPLDILLFNKLIYNIAGEALNNDIEKETIHNFLNTELYGNISKVDYNYLVESHNIFEQLIEHLRNKNLHGVKKITDYLLGAATSHRLAVEKGIITSTPLETLTEYIDHYRDEELIGWYEYFFHKLYDIKMPFSLQFVESQIKDLFCFYKKNRDVTADIVNARLKNNFA